MNFKLKSFKYITLCCFSLLTVMQGKAQQGYHKSVIKEGIKIDFTVSHVDSNKPEGEFREGDNVLFRFKIKDTISNKPLTGAFPAAWMDKINPNLTISCGKKIVSYIEGGFQSRPELDFNKYYVLTLNNDNTINVVDPLFGYGGSQLLAQIQLNGSGYDWVISEDQSLVCVSIPETSELAFINTSDMNIDTYVTIPGKPKEVSLQNDEHYLWVTYEALGHFESLSGVSIIDMNTKTLVKNIETGRGAHDIVMDQQNNAVFVSNKSDGTVSVIDLKTLEKKQDININGTPIAMGFSKKANALYVINKEESTIYVISSNSNHIIGKIPCSDGINKIEFTPNGRLAFIANPKDNTILILDSASNTIIQQADVEDHPDEISFSDELAYIRHLKSDTVWMIPLDIIGKEGGEVSLIDFSGGQNPPSLGSEACGAKGIVQAPGANAVLVSNYLDNSIYYYTEGMAAPSGQFSTYGKRPKAVLAVDKSIEEVSLGTYETTAKLRSFGDYDISLFLDTPSFMECFPITILADEEKEKERLTKRIGPLAIKYLTPQKLTTVGEEITITFELIDSRTMETVTGLNDVRLMTMNSFGKGNSKIIVKETKIKGTYSTRLKLEYEGVHYAYVECSSKGLSFNNPQFLVLYASKK